jgi:hypothetical protein
MLLAAWAVGIDDVYVYLRDEYAACRGSSPARWPRCRRTLRAPLPRMELRRGAGAYICGEESAMIESIEGKRGMPRLRPPYVAQVGLFGRPTLEHNMETLYWVRDILEKGAAWFADQGRHGRKGLRSFSVSGRVVKPGVHLAPAGITVRELIDEYCGGMQPATRSTAIFPAARPADSAGVSGDVPLDFDTLQPHGSFHRLGGRHRALAARPRAGCGTQPDAILRRRIVRPVHPLSRRHRKGRGPPRARRPGTCRCSTSCRGRWRMRRSAGWGRRRPTRSPAVVRYFPEELK